MITNYFGKANESKVSTSSSSATPSKPVSGRAPAKKKNSLSNEKKKVVKEHNGKRDLQELCSGDSYYVAQFLTNREQLKAFEHMNERTSYVPREEATMTIAGKAGIKAPRDQQFYGDIVENDFFVSYPRYEFGMDSEPDILQWDEMLARIRDRAAELVKQRLTHCVVNRYVDGDDYIGFHHDKTRSFATGSGIVTITLGSPRKFTLKRDADEETVSITVQPGSLLFMGWQTNQLWKHSVPKLKKTESCGTRISLTMRNICFTQKRKTVCPPPPPPLSTSLQTPSAVTQEDKEKNQEGEGGEGGEGEAGALLDEAEAALLEEETGV